MEQVLPLTFFIVRWPYNIQDELCNNACSHAADAISKFRPSGNSFVQQDFMMLVMGVLGCIYTKLNFYEVL